MVAMVAVKFWACSKQSHKGRRGGRSVAGRSKEAGGRHTHRRGGRMDAQWSAIGQPRKKYVLLWTLCINLSNASAFLVPPLCLLWPTNSIHWAITVATTVPPFGDHGNAWATLAMVLPPLCLLCATCCATTAALVVQGRHKGRAAAVTQKQNFLGLGDHWASWPFSGRSKLARRSQPCVKGALETWRYLKLWCYAQNYLIYTLHPLYCEKKLSIRYGTHKPVRVSCSHCHVVDVMNDDFCILMLDLYWMYVFWTIMENVLTWQ